MSLFKLNRLSSIYSSLLLHRCLENLIDSMSLSIVMINARRHVSLVFILVSCLLTVIIVFDRPYTHLFSHASISSRITTRNHVHESEYLARIHQPLSASILRGIVIYYPTDQEQNFLPELFWLYRSWIEMMKDESAFWRTDLLIYADNYTSNLRQLGCVESQIRINRQEPPQCRVFLYKRIRFRNLENPGHGLHQQFNRHRSMVLTKYVSNYDYVDSINIIAECYPSFSMYDYILRTDIDVFLTKNFAHFVPVNETLLVGKGGYSTKFNTGRLKRIANDMHWLYADLTNLGSTWYGPPQVTQRVANYSLEAMIYLAMNEFTTPEKEGRLGILLWPEWHYGVLLLYSCHLAINHLVMNESINLGLAYHLLDQLSSNSDRYDIETNNRLHIHCWHTSDPFSKFEFKAGRYSHLNPNQFLNDTSAVGYCMRMALESRWMSFAGLKQALLQVKNSTRS